MKISTRGRYALRAMMELAKNQSKGKTTLNQIAEKQDLSIKYLASLLVKLQENNLIISYKGKYGGYELAKDPSSISVADILEVVEGPLGLIRCVCKENACSKMDECKARAVWVNISQEIRSVYQKYTLDQIIV